MGKSKSIVLIVVASILSILLISLLIFCNYNSVPYVTNIEINDSKRFNDKVIFNIEIGNHFYKLNKETWCLISLNDKKPSVDDIGWQEATEGYCSFIVDSGDYHVYLKDSYGNINDASKQKVKINRVLEIKPSKTNVYLYKGQEEKISYDVIKLGDTNDDIDLSSIDNNIATVSSDGVIKGINVGKTSIKLTSKDGASNLINVVVTDLIGKPKVDLKKPFIRCGQFSNEDAILLDKILFDRIDEAGYQTRAGVVAAARFLTVDFSFRVHYFYENGRLKPYGNMEKVDGEGRYYHRGLYLSKDKVNKIKYRFNGPTMWGCDLVNLTNWGPYIRGEKYPNGLDCSGFITWVLINGGFDVGDIGAGANADSYDLDDLGTKVMISNELMNSGKVKPGDLIGFDGHMAMLAGWDDKNYYIAESLNTTGGPVITTVAKNKLVPNSRRPYQYKYIMLMDSVYKKDGKLTTMW